LTEADVLADFDELLSTLEQKVSTAHVSLLVAMSRMTLTPSE
jgi:hypothetical protein